MLGEGRRPCYGSRLAPARCGLGGKDFMLSPRFVFPSVLAFALASVSLVSACKQGQSGKAAGAAPSASGSAAAALGVCGQYSEKICATAGADSPTCSAFKSSTELMAPEACRAGLDKV